ncbi:MAG: histidinol-phosphatase [Treponema sp.]|jgi:histidinol-phosphatase (PHP family)|nr:histidinol-phosphatase [Treponema sp.]
MDLQALQANSSLHTHTVFCDGADDVETMCRVAYEKGLAAIGFSAHAPIYEKTGWKTNWHLRDFAAYTAEIQAAKIRWNGKIAVYAGLEVDFVKGLIGPADFKDAGLDYLIGSVHYLVPLCGAHFAVDGSAAELERGIALFGGVEALVNAYWDAEEALIAEGGFDILGHIDIIKKNNGNGSYFSETDPFYVERITRIADLIAAAHTQRNIAVEVNTGGLNRGKTTEIYPSPALLRLLRERNVPVILTSDAHCAEHLDGNYPAARFEMEKAGYL